MTPPRKPGATWPHVLVPEFGCFSPAEEQSFGERYGATLFRTSGYERVLHVALRTDFERQPSLAAALRSLASSATGYAEIDWLPAEQARTLVEDLFRVAAALQPTLVFMQLQRRTPIDADVIRKLREIAPLATVVNWDGDQHHEPRDRARGWFVELGHVCDASLLVTTAHPHEYAELGVRHPGYLQVGVDDVYKPAPPMPGTPEIVLLASHYSSYASRQEVVGRLGACFGTRFGVYGNGWGGSPNGHEMLKQDQESGVYAAARAAISMSIRNDLPRYTSDRLFRALASGACALVEKFPDTEGLGLVDGVNCHLWSGIDDLIRQAGLVLAERDCLVSSTYVRTKARELAVYHTWWARMGELRAILRAVRASSP